jgi:hypothetical protein
VFVRTGNYDLLAGILLSVTGCEAMFANLGQFNAASIRLSFTTLTYPALVLAYLGQGARLCHDGDAVINNVFYSTIPGKANGPLFWVVFIFAIFATVSSASVIRGRYSCADASFLPLVDCFASHDHCYLQRRAATREHEESSSVSVVDILAHYFAHGIAELWLQAWLGLHIGDNPGSGLHSVC